MSTSDRSQGRDLLTLKDYSKDEIVYLLDLAADLKAAKREGREERLPPRQEHRADLREGLDADAVCV